MQHTADEWDEAESELTAFLEEDSADAEIDPKVRAAQHAFIKARPLITSCNFQEGVLRFRFDSEDFVKAELMVRPPSSSSGKSKRVMSFTPEQVTLLLLEVGSVATW